MTKPETVRCIQNSNAHIVNCTDTCFNSQSIAYNKYWKALKNHLIKIHNVLGSAYLVLVEGFGGVYLCGSM
ncbi:uncharacterized protein CYBJADRAFT_166023 [Cyberlindnera jadinii NRRL Y-1542]|uniref:Uncharacterized protein n=1 Tax=Cyberlindnera jadinii (strain ATCC 18201 / CBS 1600 / BCRC 20928 / JCM 3617 / NBRC 0987 / NRRL Y-1542) TaxID=983966 RepID=A0A1E4S6X0_CYBJN|nr:hypothetical protein CYBJADRAFT_166023 [Cyberlindnera jadinii NRRL Y-1542]ODV75267.1 hypothetical protein CYBJADRAFT_166023 [Cyberlindnera jadinii NRRL Y-1542]